MTSYSSVTRQMLAKMTPFERGQFDRMSNAYKCPFKAGQDADQWRAGWKSQATPAIA